MYNRIYFLIVILIICVNSFYGANKLKFEFTERLRYINWNNAIDLNGETSDKFSFTRQKTTFSLNWKPSDKINMKFQLTNENRVYFLPDNKDFNIDEIIFDQLYIKLNKLFGLPLTLTAGRQNIIMGEGFLLLDYSPLDGSRSIYFNAFRSDYKFNKNNKIMAFYGYQDVNDNYLPILNPKDKNLIEQPEEGMGIYYTGIFNKISLETYYIRKNIKNMLINENLSGINTIGFRSIINFKKNLSLTTEAAYQTGFKDILDRSAIGGYFHLDYKLIRKSFKPVITFGGFYLSGDNQKTEKYEGWDPLFSRWPKWSESYIYTLIKENSVAYWSNISSVYMGLKMPISNRLGVDLAVHHLMAPEYSKAKEGFLSGSGKNRGILFTSKIKVKLNKYLKGHFVFETFKPGNFYVDGASSYHWLRFELLYKFSK